LDLPLGLRTAVQSGTAVLFIGSGIGYEALDENGNFAPDAATLAVELADRFGIAHEGTPELAQIAQIVELRKGRAELQTFLAKRLYGLEPTEHVLSLLSHRWGAIFTTNYDRVIERAYELLPKPEQQPVVVSATGDLVETDPRFEVPIYHLHGALFAGERPDILITQEDYARFGERRRMLFELLKQRFATSPFLYAGYSHKDSNWHTLQAEMRAEFAPRKPPRSYRVAKSTDPLDVEILKHSMDIETIDGTFADLAAATASIDHGGDTDRLKQIEASVPADLMEAFAENPAAVARLLSSWEYVNSAPFDAPTDVSAFLSGDLPTWALAGSDRTFERDVEEPLFDELADYATGDKQSPTSLALLGSAGYGVTTVLMKAAARLVKEEVGAVLMHKRGTPLVEGDIEFAVSVLGPRPFFVIDNAADEGSSIVQAVRRLRDLGSPACFLLGERINEWRQRRVRLSPIELEIDPLSDAEVDRLLQCLEQNGALGRLAELEPPMRVSAVKQKHEKQLLVAMKEVTENDSFDAIIEDEFRAIDGDRAQILYAAVCGFHRLRIPVRIEVLASVLGLNVVEVYDLIGPSLEGIVRVETVDEAKGIHAARARHQVIAEIVWERLVDSADRAGLLQRCLEALNLAYVLDARAFESLVRDDRGIDAIEAFEDKVRFFDKASVKDPDDPYVLQHYARMLLREKRPDLALSVIERALSIRPAVRVLHHTKGTILRHMALSTESVEIARRRLTQSEAALRESFGPQRRDAYTYQALAELYLGWAQRSDVDEVAEYVTKAEQTIRDGLQKADDREGLWLVSARVEEFLGNRPEALEALERAVKENATSPVPRYLLARSHFKAKRWASVVAVLKPVIEQEPQEYRSAVLYARALERLGEPYSKAVAILQLADLYGRRDARFIATLGGMLTMQGEFTAAEKTFAQVRDAISYRASNRIEYRPRPGDAETPTLEGVVINVRSGYAFIQSPGYPDFFCPAHEVGSRQLNRGQKVRFKPAFSARGAVATRLTID